MFLSETVKNMIMNDISLPVAMVAVLIVAGITAAASISVAISNSVLSAAGLLEIYFLFLMLKRL